MKKIISLFVLVAFSFVSYGQISSGTTTTKMYDSTRLSNDSVLVHWLNGAIKKRDTLKGFVRLSDSTLKYVTPKQMYDSLGQFLTGYTDAVNGHVIGELKLKNGSIIPISETITSLVKSSPIELTYTDENGVANVIEVTPPFSLCDTLQTLPSGSYSNGMKVVSIGGSSIPQTFVGLEFDFVDNLGGGQDATNSYLFETQHNSGNTPINGGSGIIATDIATIQAYINNTTKCFHNLQRIFAKSWNIHILCIYFV
jgi:hypothetical protein